MHIILAAFVEQFERSKTLFQSEIPLNTSTIIQVNVVFNLTSDLVAFDYHKTGFRAKSHRCRLHVVKA